MQGSKRIMKPQQHHYHSYLIRIWKENARVEWRASAQDVASGEFKYFASLVDLYHFLEHTPDNCDGELPVVSRSPLVTT